MYSEEVLKQLSKLLPFPWQKRQWAQLIQQKKSGLLAHAYLVQGSRGLGKRLLIEKFGHCLLCLKSDEKGACGQCTVCKMAAGGSLPDLLHIQPEQGSRDIKIDQIRQLASFMAKTSHSGNGKVVIVDRAHCLNNAAENALLKTLEEPSNSAFIFLITDLPGALSATIRSRCQRLKFSLDNPRDAEDWLSNNQELAIAESATLLSYSAQPLLAFAEETSSQQSDRLTVINCLEHLLQTTLELRSTVSTLVKIGELASIEYLIDVSSILIKETLIRQQLAPELAKLTELLSKLPGTGPELSLRLMTFQQELIQARRQLMSGSNPNPQLIVESLLWHWTKIAV
ncbi:MAG: DNA polymerase III subunit delta' [Pseudohongiellaceae bacterium]